MTITFGDKWQLRPYDRRTGGQLAEMVEHVEAVARELRESVEVA